MICKRCGKKTGIYTTSYFNTEEICCDGPDSCKERELKHPMYQEAVDAECAAVESGDYNFPGIGLPKDLRLEALRRLAEIQTQPPDADEASLVEDITDRS